MRRKTFDRLLSTVGAVMTVVLLVAGGLLTWASGFVGGQVRDQLVAQNIYFPPEGSPALDPEVRVVLRRVIEAGLVRLEGGDEAVAREEDVFTHGGSIIIGPGP